MCRTVFGDRLQQVAFARRHHTKSLLQVRSRRNRRHHHHSGATPLGTAHLLTRSAYRYHRALVACSLVRVPYLKPILATHSHHTTQSTPHP